MMTEFALFNLSPKPEQIRGHCTKHEGVTTLPGVVALEVLERAFSCRRSVCLLAVWFGGLEIRSTKGKPWLVLASDVLLGLS